MLCTEATPEICLKLVVVLPEVINWKGEQVIFEILFGNDKMSLNDFNNDGN